MSQRFKWLGALTLAALGLVVAVPAEAQVNATIVSKSGERTTGQLLDHGGVGFTIRVNNEERRIPTDQVAIVEFSGGAMSAADWAKVAEGSHAIWLKSGEVVTGQFYDIGGTAPLNITLKTSSGDRQFSSNDIARIVLARTADAVATTGGQTAQTPSTPGGGFVVSAQQQWTSTGLQVRRGEWLTFNASGQVQLSSDSGDTATPAGSTRQRNPVAGAPLTNAPAGALVGRVGNGPAFLIGGRDRVRMTENGTLFLGVNDDHTGDNSGEFRVEIQRATR